MLPLPDELYALAADTVSLQLPDNCLFSFAKYICTNTHQPHDYLDSARRALYRLNRNKTIVDSILPYVVLSPGDEALWVFSFQIPLQQRLEHSSFHTPNLNLSYTDSFRFRDLYPCSQACASERHPCPKCIDNVPVEEVHNHTATVAGVPLFEDASCRLPRETLRTPYACLLNALRERIIDDLCLSSPAPAQYSFRRCQNGALAFHPRLPDEWQKGWEYDIRLHSLVYCRLELSLSSSSIRVQPICETTELLPLLSITRQGSPLTLLPFATPAYFLSIYNGPSDILMQQFRSALEGLGVGGLGPVAVDRLNGSGPVPSGPRSKAEPASSFSVVWVPVDDLAGEDKGLVVIWPTQLCVVPACESSSEENGQKTFAYGRTSLTQLPPLHVALQASPVPAPAFPAKSTVVVDSPIGADLSPTGEKLANALIQPTFLDSQVISLPMSRRSKFDDSATAFKAISSSFSSRQNAIILSESVNQYVACVAKERERERERIRKKEKESFGNANAATPPGHEESSASHNISLTPLGQSSDQMNYNEEGNAALNFDSFPSDAEAAFSHSAQPSYPSPPEDAGVPPDFHMNIEELELPTPGITPFKSDGDLEFLANAPSSAGMDVDISNAVLEDLPQSASVVADMSLDAFGAFTDDDFDFFDNPHSLPHASDAFTSKKVEAHFETLNDSFEQLLQSGSFGMPLESTDPASVNASYSLGIPSSSGDLTKHSGDENIANSSAPPYLSPASPTRSASTQPSPPTPSFAIIGDNSGDEINSLQVFLPLGFARTCSEADGKYIGGKFTKTHYSAVLRPRNILEPKSRNFRTSGYDEATDPRISVIRQLAGRKRKMVAQGECPEPYIQNGDDEWLDIGDPETVDDFVEIENDDDCLDDDESISLSDDYPLSRQRTPPPSYLPLGPSLVTTCFAHYLLRPLSMNLHASDSPFQEENNVVPMLNPVPTPVSPGTLPASANEKLKALEPNIRAFVRELACNELWASHVLSLKSSTRQQPHSDSFDCSLATTAVLRRLGECGFITYKSMGQLIETSATYTFLSRLENPTLTCGKGAAIVRVSHFALEFWDRLGLGPRSGTKDVSAFAIYLDRPDVTHRIHDWLQLVSTVYAAKGYGVHSPGKAQTTVTDGLVPITFDALRKTCSHIFSESEGASPNVLFYIFIPIAMLSSTSPGLKQVMSTLRRLVTELSSRFTFLLVPEAVLNDVQEVASNLEVNSLVNLAYNKLRKVTKRFSLQSLKYSDGTKAFEAPATTIAPYPNESSNLENTFVNIPGDHRGLFHVGYTLSADGKWLLAACVDQKGELHDTAVWFVGEEHDIEDVLDILWRFAMSNIKEFPIRWHITFAKLGCMEEQELKAWSVFLSKSLASNVRESTDPYVSLLSIQCRYIHGPPFKEKKSDNPELQFKRPYTLSSSLDCLLQFTHGLQLPRESRINDIFGQPKVCREKEVNATDQNLLKPIRSFTILRTSRGMLQSVQDAAIVHLLDIQVPDSLKSDVDKIFTEICRNFHELSVLGHRRWHNYSKLPFHLAALASMEGLFEDDYIPLI